jgi:tRNA pseudouridine55 synthase
VDGILNINKPPGITSFGVVAWVKKLSHQNHTGHAGTLDPLAIGVLPVCLGKATRIVEFLSESQKTYRAEVDLGLVSDTYDTEGTIIEHGDVSGVTLDRIEPTLNSFRGPIRQIPPMYSAIKLGGRPLYELAREGITVDRKARCAHIFRLELLEWKPPILNLEIGCSKGTYIRSLAHDLGQELGCGAILKNLVRTRYGPFDIKDSISLSRLEEAARQGILHELLYPLDYPLSSLPMVVIDDSTAQDIKNGKPVILDDCAPEDNRNVPQGSSQESIPPCYCRAYSKDGRFLALLRFIRENGTWHPKKVFI